MKKFIAVLLVISIFLSLSGCKDAGRLDDGFMDTQSSSEEEPGYEVLSQEMQSSVASGYFEVRLFTNRDTYADGEVVDCWIIVEYIGDEESITVYPANGLKLPITFSVLGKEYYDEGLMEYKEGEQITFFRGDPVRFDYKKESGKMLYKNPHAPYLRKYYTNKELVLPPGDYEIGALFNVFLEPTRSVSCLQYVWVNIEVTK